MITSLVGCSSGYRIVGGLSNGRAFTWSEHEAQRLTGKGLYCTDSNYTPHDAGNEIIELAERIKSERAIMAMENT